METETQEWTKANYESWALILTLALPTMTGVVTCIVVMMRGQSRMTGGTGIDRFDSSHPLWDHGTSC